MKVRVRRIHDTLFAASRDELTAYGRMAYSAYLALLAAEGFRLVAAVYGERERPVLPKWTTERAA